MYKWFINRFEVLPGFVVERASNVGFLDVFLKHPLIALDYFLLFSLVIVSFTGGKRMGVTKSYNHPEMGDNSRDKFFFSDFRAVKGSFEPNCLSHTYYSAVQ